MRVHLCRIDYSYTGVPSGYEYWFDEDTPKQRTFNQSRIFDSIEKIARAVFNSADSSKPLGLIEADFMPPSPIVWFGGPHFRRYIPLTQEEQELFWNTFKEFIINKFGFDD